VSCSSFSRRHLDTRPFPNPTYFGNVIGVARDWIDLAQLIEDASAARLEIEKDEIRPASVGALQALHHLPGDSEIGPDDAAETAIESKEQLSKILSTG